MLGLMLVSVNEAIWPAWFAVVFGAYYLAEFDNETKRYIYESLIDGIFVIAFMVFDF